MRIEQRQLSEYSASELQDIKKEFEGLRIITQTFYGNDETSRVRQQLALDFFENAKKLGLKVIVVDGGSNEAFISTVKTKFADTVILYSETEVPEQERGPNGRVGMGTGRRFGFAKATEDSDAKYFLWTEPEKSDLLTVDNLRSMLVSLKNNEADVSVPKRLDKDSMAPFQAWLESWANIIAARLLAEKKQSFDPSAKLKRPLDLWFGPKAFNRNGAKEFLDYRSSLDKWDANIAPASNAEVRGLRVNSVDVIYNYDPSQVKNEVGNKAIDAKRWDQFLSILNELGSKQAGEFYARIKQGENINALIPQIIETFGMEDGMPDEIREYLGLQKE